MHSIILSPICSFFFNIQNFFFLVILAGYISLVLGALKYYELLYTVAAIAFMSPYFLLMLKALPILKGFYIEKYATVAGHLP